MVSGETCSQREDGPNGPYDTYYLIHVPGRVAGPGAVEEGEAGGESLHRQPVRRVGDM